MRRRPPHWNPRGPVPPGEQDPDQRPGPGETLDCLSGHWKLFQLRRGHRYSIDDLLTAWYAVQAATERGRTGGRHLDLGCGVGSIGLLVLWQLPEMHSLGIEAQAVSAALARRSIRYNGVEARSSVRCADFREPTAFEIEERFDLVTASPPYLAPAEGRRSTLPQRGPCRFEDRGGAADYLRIASARLEPGGSVVWVHATRCREANLRAAGEGGVGGIHILPVLFQEDSGSLISLFRAVRGADWSVAEHTPLIIRRRDGSWSPEYVQIRQKMGFPA